MRLLPACILVLLLISCSNNTTEYENPSYSYTFNDTFISKAYLIGENWLHGDIQYKPFMVPVKDVDIGNMDLFFKNEYFGLAFWTEVDFMYKSNFKFTTFTKISKDDNYEKKFDTIKVAPVVVIFVERNLLSGNKYSTINRYNEDGNIDEYYDIGVNCMKLKEFNYRYVQFSIDNRYVEVIDIKPYDKSIRRVCEYFEKCKK